MKVRTCEGDNFQNVRWGGTQVYFAVARHAGVTGGRSKTDTTVAHALNLRGDEVDEDNFDVLVQ